VSLTSSLAGAGASQGSSLIEPGKTFSDDILLLLSSSIRQREQECEDLLAAHPVQCDWLCQDTGTDITDFLDAADPADILSSIIRDALAQPGAAGDEFRKTFESIEKSGANLKALLELYVRICEHRRRLRLQKLRATWPAIVFMKNIELGNAPRGPMSLSKGPYKGGPSVRGLPSACWTCRTRTPAS
jgi:hypothetical protein